MIVKSTLTETFRLLRTRRYTRYFLLLRALPLATFIVAGQWLLSTLNADPLPRKFESDDPNSPHYGFSRADYKELDDLEYHKVDEEARFRLLGLTYYHVPRTVQGASYAGLLGTSSALPAGLTALSFLLMILGLSYYQGYAIIDSVGQTSACDWDTSTIHSLVRRRALWINLLLDIVAMLLLAVALLPTFALQLVVARSGYGITPVFAIGAINVGLALWLGVRFMFAQAAILGESESIIGGISRSFELTRGKAIDLWIILLITLSPLLIIRALTFESSFTPSFGGSTLWDLTSLTVWGGLPNGMIVISAIVLGLGLLAQWVGPIILSVAFVKRRELVDTPVELSDEDRLNLERLETM